jgi:DUF971 family protein
MNARPSDIKADTQQHLLAITWSDGPVMQYPFVALRGACRCAACIDEMTGEPILDPATIPDDITIKDMQLVGNYAVKIFWSDGHDTGLYTWQHLRNREDAR